MALFTEEQQEQANIARRALIDHGNATYRTIFSDDDHWIELAKAYGQKLPKWYLPPEPRRMRSWLRKLGLKEKAYKEACGEGWELEDFALLNPDWPLRAFAGILLEYYDELQTANSINRQHTHRWETPTKNKI